MGKSKIQVRDDLVKKGRENKSKKEASSNAQTKNIMFLALFAGTALPVMLPVYDYCSTLFWPNYTQLSPTDPALNSVFFGGDPWAVLCLDPEAKIPDIWSETAALASSDPYNVEYVKFGVLDCAAPLPSGKTTYERFKLSQTDGSTPAFWVANGNRPTSLPADYFVPSSVNAAELAPRLLDTITKQTRVKAKSVTTNKELWSRCLKYPNCGLLLNPGSKLTETHEETMHKLMTNHRTFHWATLDTKQKKMSLESKLPPILGLEGKEAKREPRLVYFKREKNKDAQEGDDNEFSVYAKAHRDRFEDYSVEHFIQEIISDDDVKFAEMKELPTIRKRSKSSKKKKSKKSKTPEEKAAEKAQKAKDKEARDLKRKMKKMKKSMEAEDDAELTAKQKKKQEQRRREKMDQEQEAATPKYMDDWDEEVVDFDEFDEFDEDEEEIDLDAWEDDDEYDEETIDLD